MAEARAAAARFETAGLRFDAVFTSALIRTRRSAEIILAELRSSAPIVSDVALNERDYGELTGLNKNEARARFGEFQINRWRRSYAERPPGGESLRDAQARLLCYNVRTLLPEVMKGLSVLMVGHGNTLRALVMAFDDVSAEAIETLEFATSEAVGFNYDARAAVVRRFDLRS